MSEPSERLQLVCGEFARFKPFWPDFCGHGGYVISFECFLTTADAGPAQLDLYVFNDDASDVCMRFGEEPSHYYGMPLTAVLALNLQPYIAAAKLLCGLGTIRWHRKEKTCATTCAPCCAT